VRPDVVEDLGSETHVIFTIDAPHVSAEAVRAASEATEDTEGKLFADDVRAVFTAVLDARRAIAPGADIELAVHHDRFHLFDPGTGLALDSAARATLVA
jgi:multiple sugar transport system ATP-binding protein